MPIELLTPYAYRIAMTKGRLWHAGVDARISSTSTGGRIKRVEIKRVEIIGRENFGTKEQAINEAVELLKILKSNLPSNLP